MHEADRLKPRPCAAPWAGLAKKNGKRGRGQNRCERAQKVSPFTNALERETDREGYRRPGSDDL